MQTILSIMTKKEPYVCPRCGYSTRDRSCMKKHLYVNKKPCPGTKSTGELSDTMREYILANRIFIEPVAPAPTFNQTINNYNTMNNFVAALDPLTKLKEYSNYKKVDVLPFDRDVELKYEKKRMRLEDNTFDYEHHSEDILDIIDKVSSCREPDASDFNLLYDKSMNKFLMYDLGDWQERLAVNGVQSVVNTIKDYFWNAFECYLIRRIEQHDNEVRMSELLDNHYRFLASVECGPFIVDKHDKQIMFNMDDDLYWEQPDFNDVGAHKIRDDYMGKFTRIQQSISRKDKEDEKKKVVGIIMRNSKKNMLHLNKLLVSIMQGDDEFKHTLLPTVAVTH